MFWSDADKETVATAMETGTTKARDIPELCFKYGEEAVSRRMRRIKRPGVQREAPSRLEKHNREFQTLTDEMMEESDPDPKNVEDLDPFLEQVLTTVQKAMKKKQFASVISMADQLDVGPSRVKDGVEALKELGYRMRYVEDHVEIAPPTKTGYVPIPLEHYREGDWYELGIVSDTHLCSEKARLDVDNAAYDFFEEQGIRVVLHAGNYIDGERSFNRNELLTSPGIERQISYFLENYPQRSNINTFYIDGEDHEGWYGRDIGLNVGQTVEDRARKKGREDLHFLGMHEVDIPFWAKDGKRPAILKLMHGGGGSSYAISYVVQKYIEALSSGEKPNIILIGHFHKEMFAHIRGVHSLLCASMMDQTLWMRKLKISSVVGFHTIRFKVDKLGTISRFQVEWFPFYNVGFYKDRYTPGTIAQLVATPHEDDDAWIEAIAQSLALGDR